MYDLRKVTSPHRALVSSSVKWADESVLRGTAARTESTESSGPVPATRQGSGMLAALIMIVGFISPFACVKSEAHRG